MTYTEVVNKLRSNERVYPRDVKGYWMFYLLQDREIKNIQCRHKLYEVNFIPVAPCSSGVYVINECTCPDWSDALSIMNIIITAIEDGLHGYVVIDEEYFEVKLEVLETDE